MLNLVIIKRKCKEKDETKSKSREITNWIYILLRTSAKKTGSSVAGFSCISEISQKAALEYNLIYRKQQAWRFQKNHLNSPSTQKILIKDLH